MGSYLSRDRGHLAALQRKRRARMVRIDYMPSDAALAAIEAKRTTLPEWGGLSTNSATIDAIVTEWAELTGIKREHLEPSMSSGSRPEFAEPSAQARMTSEEVGASGMADAQANSRPKKERGGIGGSSSGVISAHTGACGRANESGAGGGVAGTESPPESLQAQWRAPQLQGISRRRVTCGARRVRDGKPCQAKSEPGKRRCKFHGGRSTGPRTPEGKARALANLRQYRMAAE